jgi:hypothetical protein
MDKTTNGHEVLTTQDARALLQAERKERSEACSEALKGILAQYRCRLEAVVILRAGQVNTEIQVMAED